MSNTQELEKAQNGSDNYEEYFLISENAPIWSLYNDESSKIDAALQDMANKSIDVLLVFTGLFSAVLTALIIFVYQSSTPGPLDQSNALLIQYFQAQNITLNNSALSASPPSSVISGQKLAWVNAIWMISIALSLADATFCILAKQWLRFQPIISGSPRFKARQRQRRYTQFEAWHVMTVVNTLPIFLHVAILLFFIGLVIMLWGGSLSVTVIVLIAVASVVGCYIGSIWLSLLYPDCPFQHPISEQLRFWRNTRSKQGYADLERTSRITSSFEMRAFDNGAYDMDADDKLDALALVWLLENCSSRSTPVLGALQAIGQLPSHFTALYYLQRAGAISLILEEFRACFRFEIQADLFVDHRDQWRVVDYYNAEKYCRSWMRLTRGTTAIWPAELVPLLDAIVAESSSHYLDVQSVEPILVCVRTIVASTTHDSQDARLALLDIFPKMLSHFRICGPYAEEWCLESFLRASFPFRSSARPTKSVQRQATPILLRLLRLRKACMTPTARQYLALSLSYLTGNLQEYDFLRTRRYSQSYCCSPIVAALGVIIEDDKDVYGIDDSLLDFSATEFCRISSAVVTSTHPSEQRALRIILPHVLLRMYQYCVAGRLKTVSFDTLRSFTVTLCSANQGYSVHLEYLLRSAEKTPPKYAIGREKWLSHIADALSTRDLNQAIIGHFIALNGLEVLLNAYQNDIGWCIGNRRYYISIMSHLHNGAATYYASESLMPTSNSIDNLLQREAFFRFPRLLLRDTQPCDSIDLVQSLLESLISLCRMRPHHEEWAETLSNFQDFATTHWSYMEHCDNGIRRDIKIMEALISSSAT